MLKVYNIEALGHLSAMIKDQNDAKEWLVTNGYRELAEFWDAYIGIEKSFKWLLDNGYKHLAAAVDAASGEDKAKLWLIANGYRELAAFISASEGNEPAVHLLMKSDYKGLVTVAHEIYEYNKKKTKGIMGFFNGLNPFR
jgi:hypothetical protein